MVIMNKAMAVRVRDLIWLKTDLFFQANTSNLPIKYVALSEVAIIKCDGYTPTNLNRLNSLDNSIAVSDSSRHCIRIRVSNQASTSLEAFLASEGDKFITYETIDSVEEEIMSRTRNLWDEQWELGTLDATGKTSSTTRIRCKNYIPILPNTQYLVTGFVNGRALFYDANLNILSYEGSFVSLSPTFTTPSNAAFMLFCPPASYGSTYKHDIAIVKGTTGVYEPFVIPTEIINTDQ